MLRHLRRAIQPILDSPNADTRRPVIDTDFESNISGLFVIGDLGGAPVVKLAMAQGSQVADHIAAKPDARTAAASADPNRYDLIVVGAGAAGLNAALGAQAHGLRVVVIEKNKIANTIEDFPEGKWIYAEPDSVPAKGTLWLEGASKEDLLARWRQTVEAARLNIHTGEDLDTVFHRLYSPKHYRGEDILVVGGGNSAVEAALALADQNRVILSYRGPEFTRVFKDNRRKLREATEAGRIQVIFNSQVRRFDDGVCALDIEGAGPTPVT